MSASLDLGTLKIKIGVDNGDAVKELDSTGSKLSSFASTAGNVLKGMATATTAAVGAASAAVAGLTKVALDNYASNEQLVGGVETLFKESSAQVVEYANDAYKTAGMSANEYMETVTGFSASLLQSLGGDTAAAAQVANQAVTDMSDNANKMGTSIESIQNAYQGFAKGNFTMLDNLKLGYGGTKEEMERLLADAEAIQAQQGVMVDYSITSFADITEAIHVVQTEIGITGTTALEASTTIQGSLDSMKGAWTNLMAGIGDESANTEQLVNNFVDSVSTAAENMVPRITQILEGIGEMARQLGPKIAEALPGLVSEVLPALLGAATSMIDGLIDGLSAALPALAAAVPQIIETICNVLTENLPQIVEMALTIIIALAESLIENLPQIIEAGIAAILALVDGLTASLPELIPVAVEAIITIVNGLLDNLDKIIEAALELILALAEGLIAAIPKLLEAVPQIITKLIGAFTENFPKMIETGVKLLVSLVQNMPAIIAGILKALPQILAALVKGFAEMVPDLAECGLNLIKGLWDGITGAAGWLYEKISDFCSGIVESVKGFFKINSPSKVFAEIGGFLDMGLGEGIEDNAAEAFDAIDDLSRGIEDRFNPDLSGYSYGNQSMSYIAGSGRNASAGNSGIGGGNNITQNNYFTAPEMTAYEQQVQIKRLERDLVGGLK